MKKIIFSLLSIILACTLVLPNDAGVLAKEVESITNEQGYTEAEFTMEEIMALEQYISVSSEGLFIMNNTEAIADGVSLKLLEGQQRYFDSLNLEIKEGILKVNKNLEIINLDSNFDKNLSNGEISLYANCNGVTTNPVDYWWGKSRKFNSCHANEFAADLASVAAGAVGAGILAFWVPGMGWASLATSAYCAHYSARVYANNSYNTGVKIDMTWAMVYDITPQ